MPFFKQVELKDAIEKYGFSHSGLFAKEFIKKGEAISTCDRNKCDYLQVEDFHLATTKAETEAIMKEYPESKEFITKYIYMLDDDMYDYPRNYKEKQINENCLYFNHSCEPNTGFGTLDSGVVIAIRDIQIGDELTYDYQCMDTEASYYRGLQCKCGSLLCRGALEFSDYRHVDWQNRMLKYSGSYIKSKVEELKTKWYSSECCLRRFFPNPSDRKTFQLKLTTLKKVPKHTLVAKFSDTIAPNNHFIQHSETPNCFLENNDVFTLTDIDQDTELTLNFSEL